MARPTLADYDPLPLAIEHLSTHPRMLAVLGGDGRVFGDNEPPYPMIRLRYVPGGFIRASRWLAASRVEVSVYGDLDGTPGEPTLRRALMLALDLLGDLPDMGQDDPTRSVVTAAEFGGAGGPVPEPNGQPRWVSEVTLWGHPPMVVPD